MTNKFGLSASHIRYLVTLKQLHTAQGVRSVDVANRLCLTKSSVHNMMDHFLEWSYIHKEPNRAVFLTEQGMARAAEYEGYFQRLHQRLCPQGMADQTVELGIYALLAELSDQALAALV